MCASIRNYGVATHIFYDVHGIGARVSFGLEDGESMSAKQYLYWKVTYIHITQIVNMEARLLKGAVNSKCSNMAGHLVTQTINTHLTTDL